MATEVEFQRNGVEIQDSQKTLWIKYYLNFTIQYEYAACMAVVSFRAVNSEEDKMPSSKTITVMTVCHVGGKMAKNGETDLEASEGHPYQTIAMNIIDYLK